MVVWSKKESMESVVGTSNYHIAHMILLLFATMDKRIKHFGFLPARRYASAGNSDRNVSVRPSVGPSRAGIVSKRRKLAARFLHHLVAPRL